VVGEWASLLTDRQALAGGFAKHAPGLFSDGQIESIHRWCVDRERLRTGSASADDGEHYALDAEDEACFCASTSFSADPCRARKDRSLPSPDDR
jgi:hypothetical protein